jgi:2-oxoglutarate ferredoxin oxidoreductase subunit gamma
VTNVVMLDFFTAVTQAVPNEAMVEAIRASVPKGTIDLNLEAFDLGYDTFQEGTGK